MTILRLAALIAAAASAPAAIAAPQQARPQLVVAIAVDQLSADLFEQYRPHFTGGLARLSRGTVFPSGYQSHAATETCPGHSTILTGSRPARTGVIANNWFDMSSPREDKYIYCAEDPRVPGSSARNYTVSSHHLRVPALGDLMKRADPRSRVVAIAGKDRAAVMMGGHGPDQRWWWSGEGFTGAGALAPAASVARVNQGIAELLKRPREPMDLPGLCAAKARGVALSGGGGAVGEGRFARAAGDARAFRTSPELDGATLVLAATMREEMKLGEGPASDLLIVGLSASDYVGHRYGTQGSEMCLQLLSLDEDLGEFFQLLDQTGVDYMVVLTADHGGPDIPERAGGSTQRVDRALFATTMGRTLRERLGLAGPVLYGDGAFGEIYIDTALAPADRRRVLDAAVTAYRSHPQVAEVLTAEQIRATPMPSGSPASWTMIQRARASHDPERSGDFLVLLREGVMPIFDTSRGYVATHGSPWDYDRRVPILFWRAGMRQEERAEAIETIDIMPTLADALGLPIAAGSIDGKCLRIGGTSCR